MDQPTNPARILQFICGICCLIIFLLPVCAIIYHCSEVFEAEKRWKETERIEQEKTNKVIRQYNNVMRKAAENRR